MSAPATSIDRLRIATPCPVAWDQMTGDNRVRFCDHCQLNVYNISELSRNEAQALIASTEGRLCARLFRRADGTILTKDCPVGLRALRMRVSKRAAAVFAVVVSIAAAAFGQQSTAQGEKDSCPPDTKITIKSSPSDQVAARLSGVVLDPNGAVIAGAQILITDQQGKEINSAVANDEGKFRLDGLPEGNYLIKVTANGFAAYVTQLLVERNSVINLEVVLEPGTVGVVMLEEQPRFASTPGTTIISSDLIRRLPIQK